MGKGGNSDRLYLGAPKSLQMVIAAIKFKRCLLLGRKIKTSIDSILKSRDMTLPTKVHLIKASHVWMWELDYKEIWALKYWCFWTVELNKGLLRVPWTARRSNQSTLKEISPDYSVEGLMLKLKFQYFSHLMRRNDSLEKTLMLGGIGGRRRRGRPRMRWLDGIMPSVSPSLRQGHGNSPLGLSLPG